MTKNMENTLTVEAAYEVAIAMLQESPYYSVQNIEDEKRLREMWEIDMASYGDCVIDFETFRTWWDQYPLGSKIYVENDQIVISYGLYPIAAEQATRFMNGEIKEEELRPVCLDECESHPQTFWYASGIVTNPFLEQPIRIKEHPIKPLFKIGLSLWGASGHVAFPATIFALGLTQKGENFLRRSGFKQTKPGSEMPDHCPLYQSNVESSRHIMELFNLRNL